MKKLLLIALLIVSPAMAATDFNCLNDCTAKGYMYNLCQQKCSYDIGGSQQQAPQTYQAPQIKQTDFKCLNQCTAQGYMYGFCKDRCSY